MDQEMFKKLEEVRNLLTDPEPFNRLVAKYEANPTEENLREIIDLMTIELAKGNIKDQKGENE